LSEFTLKDKVEKLPELRFKFVNEATKINSTKRTEEKLAMTNFICQTILKQIPELLRNQYLVRLQATELISELDYAPAHETLIQLIQAKDVTEDEKEGQPIGVKIAAAKGVVRLLRFANPRVQDRMTIAHAVIEQLKDDGAHWWLQVQFIDALRYCEISGVDTRNNDNPFVVECLLSIIKDEQRPWRVRSRACYAIGRVPLPKGIRSDDVVTAVCTYALKLTRAAEKRPNDPHWKNSIWDVYLAFHKGGISGSTNPKDQDLDAEKKISGGLLERIKPAPQPAYEAIVPIVNDIMNGKAPDAGNVNKLGEFVRGRA